MSTVSLRIAGASFSASTPSSQGRVTSHPHMVLGHIDCPGSGLAKRAGVKREPITAPVLLVDGQEAGEMVTGVREAGVQAAPRFIFPELVWNRDDDGFRIHHGYMASRDRFCTPLTAAAASWRRWASFASMSRMRGPTFCSPPER